MIKVSVYLFLTWGVVGHISPHGIRPWPSLVYHSMHAVHARTVWRACSHYALRHVRVARRPREENVCLERKLKKLRFYELIKPHHYKKEKKRLTIYLSVFFMSYCLILYQTYAFSLSCI